MTKRSFDFRNIKQNVPFNRDILDRETLRREIAQKRDSLKRTVSEKRDALKRGSGAGAGHSVTLTRTRKVAMAGVATLGATAIGLSLAPHDTQSDADHSSPAAYTVSSKQSAGGHASDTSQHKDATSASAKHDTATKAKSDDGKSQGYADNLHGWIRESLAIMKKHHIPGSYDGLYRNIMRESSGNPSAINNWDINAQKGTPSKGLLQVIPPTFKQYHVSGTSWNIYDPVANITAAANYAADRYGSMDNVNSAY